MLQKIFPLRIEVEGDNRVPVSGPAGSVAIRFLPLIPNAIALEAPFTASSLSVTQPISEPAAQPQTYEFAVSVMNLPRATR